MLELQPIDFEEAVSFIKEHHRHHQPPQGWKFGIAVNDGKKVVGVCTIGRPVARKFDDGRTLEVTRCCSDGTKNVCSMLYSAAWRAVKAMGYYRLVTYTHQSEPGTSLVASNWKKVSEVSARQWSCPSRPRVENKLQRKFRWEPISEAP